MITASIFEGMVEFVIPPLNITEIISIVTILSPSLEAVSTITQTTAGFTMEVPTIVTFVHHRV
jgi:hypothetical protein